MIVAFVYLCSFLPQNLTLLLVIVTAALHLYFLTQRQRALDFRLALTAAPGSAAVFSMSVIVLGPMMALFLYHVRVRGVRAMLLLTTDLRPL